MKIAEEIFSQFKSTGIKITLNTGLQYLLLILSWRACIGTMEQLNLISSCPVTKGPKGDLTHSE